MQADTLFKGQTNKIKVTEKTENTKESYSK